MSVLTVGNVSDENGKSDMSDVSDGFHTFGELYDHRIALFMVVLTLLPENAFRAKRHSDGTSFEGWFVAGLSTDFGQITYHLPISKWELLNKSDIKTMDKAPEFDGHSSDDVVVRLGKLVRSLSKS
jgi:hypothetical protein